MQKLDIRDIAGLTRCAIRLGLTQGLTGRRPVSSSVPQGSYARRLREFPDRSGAPPRVRVELRIPSATALQSFATLWLIPWFGPAMFLNGPVWRPDQTTVE
jgi:hypothetical protein